MGDKMRAVVDLPQSLADAHTLVAQKYAGYFVGHPYRAAQQRVGPDAIRVDTSKAWTEPLVTADGCDFCRRLTDEEAERRVAGYQHAIDIEVLRPHALAYATWLGSGARREEHVGGSSKPRSQNSSASDRRAFIETHRDILQVQPYPMIDLPLRLKRKLCIEWNHLYRDYIESSPGVRYDFDNREFYREVDEPTGAGERIEDWWQTYVPGVARSRR
jgi:hypothetical protein